MYAFASEHTLHYQITNDTSGYRLSLWEMAAHPEGRPKPYLYRINYSLASWEEAQALLRQHLALNGMDCVSDLTLPRQGKVRILPHPTWSLEA
ncbi:hypothetical protein XM38_000280 [Halomicronema hongdechloris C2206]|uniref:Uncharacterized protein n=2 Tax=Halomicronema hongdechloris TaxID=1209493 RepID=A0A1Z3HFP8_9CYAN|nr:hypothetical protein XM38_000280 [Halomicronema hongdechloris C2206]